MLITIADSASSKKLYNAPMADFNRGRGGGNRGGFGSGGNRGGGGRRFGGGSFQREMHPATCSNCGKDCEVPFRPTGEKPVFCNDCFRKDSGDSQPRGRGRYDRDERPRQAEQPNYQFQFDSINKKLAEIMDRLATLLPAPASHTAKPELKLKAKAKKKDLKAPKILKKVKSKKA
jgi:CxxC-x17-CxxC domain-containing protein